MVKQAGSGARACSSVYCPWGARAALVPQFPQLHNGESWTTSVMRTEGVGKSKAPDSRRAQEVRPPSLLLLSITTGGALLIAQMGEPRPAWGRGFVSLRSLGRGPAEVQLATQAPDSQPMGPQGVKTRKL